MIHRFIVVVLFVAITKVFAEDGYRLWLRYDPINNPGLLKEYKAAIQSLYLEKTTPTLTVAKTELLTATR
ncbi:MAG TPA: alpha-glucuronidase family glycosyl hydrolase, partial [Chryseolinea sp.]|nr:alpha-glucuronidase family glycosyl hydrolase [Chryseolinea sp.]